MFTGLVKDLGRVAEVERSGGGARLRIDTALAGELRQGDSVAVNGVCLTATAVDGSWFDAEAMNETLTRTSLGALRAGAAVNLELPLRAGEPLGGHLVQGHVDGMGRIAELEDDGFARRLRIQTGAEILRYVVEKGSIAVDGISLTVVDVAAQSFTVSLIPETLERTNLGASGIGSTVNLEVDVLAKYVEKAVRR
ncbi:MAG TPA: riboflavin synthase [Solirubrobacteraceae bacterium]|nr:riboflavin synthase [Solirubrobacteraceae bacterium]